MVRIKDVARLANVSTATVSRVLSNADNVTEETKEKVLNAIQELNYSPNILGRYLRKMETQTILVVVPDITNTFFSKILRGIESIAVQNGYQVLLADTQNNVRQEVEYLNLLRQKRVDGMILLTARMDRSLVEEIAEEYPVVLACEYLEGSRLPTVSIDNVSSARKATEHLIKLGHRRIAHISGPMDIILSRDRLRGYQQAMAQYELKFDPVLIQEGDFSYEIGYNMAMKYLALENLPTAIFAANDEMAIGAMKAIREHSLNVPDDIAVMGFDNIKISSIVEPALTTIAQPMYEIGTTSMEILLKLINGEDLKKRQFVLEDQLIIRESCGGKVRF
ncbi:LacI family DNA-binding transcriptional regulator [Effusibacillus lacus]|uniref:LacI family transcriptional regulator n=1 Tax=Effusibacillus lacus TaxID=1348429 RepID=A0A292YSX3_9BACL|nr:LacI family DNA-binding transcriptional regulator [Effusibacillus lacus]TCS73770.1 LacI family transcriptional regulator [Effusibacillus lacus]GAX92019.1 LacI family transcriptional regulator [Effusibacillus lacus]